MKQSLRQLQSLLGAQVDHEFDLTLVPQIIQTAQNRLTLLAPIPNSWPVAKKRQLLPPMASVYIPLQVQKNA